MVSFIGVVRFGVDDDILSHDLSMRYVTARDGARVFALGLPFHHRLTIVRRHWHLDRLVACVWFGSTQSYNDPGRDRLKVNFLRGAAETAGVLQCGDRLFSSHVGLPPTITDEDLLDDARRQFARGSVAVHA